MTAHPDDFSHGIARVLQGESMKAGCYVDHGLSLGVLREKMVARLIRNETPERYRVETGLIRDHEGHTPSNSRQIDLLVHDPTDCPPLYRWEDFVVVPWNTAKAAVEVKSKLDEARYRELIELHLSIRAIDRNSYGGIATFGYALTGVGFETFVSYLAATILENRIMERAPKADSGQYAYLNLPTCIVVQSENYLAVSPNVCSLKDWHCCVVRYSGFDYSDGTETGKLIEIYSKVIEPNRSMAITSEWVHDWFASQDVPPESKAYVGRDGIVHHGELPSHS